MESERHIDQAALQDVLQKILPSLQGVLGKDDYRLVGTAAALLHGCEVPVEDIDFLARRRSHVDAFAAALSNYACLVPPTFVQWSPPPHEAGQYWCCYLVDGICVEASTVEVSVTSDFLEVSGAGLWTHYTDIKVGAYYLPTVKLELRLATELQRHRKQKYEPILDRMAKNGCDLALLKRAMEACRVPAERQNEVLLRLAGRH
ncbi:MAG TPA: hypothetical protein GXX29_10880 [Firmicutes bacterium]|nr:hypothetical protein [Bacillota bacterium]